MENKGGITMSGLSILGFCLIIIGLLTIVFGGSKFGISMTNPDFTTFLVGGLFIILIGTTLVPNMPLVCKLASLAFITLVSSWYIYQIQGMDITLRLISIVVVLGFAVWFTMLFLRK